MLGEDSHGQARQMFEMMDKDGDGKITEKEFIDSILESGILIYLSATWLAQVYQIVIQCDLFEGCQIATPLTNICSGKEDLELS